MESKFVCLGSTDPSTQSVLLVAFLLSSTDKGTNKHQDLAAIGWWSNSTEDRTEQRLAVSSRMYTHCPVVPTQSEVLGLSADGWADTRGCHSLHHRPLATRLGVSTMRFWRQVSLLFSPVLSGNVLCNLTYLEGYSVNVFELCFTQVGFAVAVMVTHMRQKRFFWGDGLSTSGHSVDSLTSSVHRWGFDITSNAYHWRKSTGDATKAVKLTINKLTYERDWAGLCSPGRLDRVVYCRQKGERERDAT